MSDFVIVLPRGDLRGDRSRSSSAPGSRRASGGSTSVVVRREVRVRRPGVEAASARRRRRSGSADPCRRPPWSRGRPCHGSRRSPWPSALSSATRCRSSLNWMSIAIAFGWPAQMRSITFACSRRLNGQRCLTSLNVFVVDVDDRRRPSAVPAGPAHREAHVDALPLEALRRSRNGTRTRSSTSPVARRARRPGTASCAAARRRLSMRRKDVAIPCARRPRSVPCSATRDEGGAIHDN